ncbi:radical SAM protein [Candidatus Woesearchaeota archaeon]|nr:radical SAM protein [Candidatus Woesearchaeota archaeon]
MRLDLKVGFSCNMRCNFCVQGDKRLCYKDKTTEELTKLIEENYARGIKEIVFTGGEPTVRKDIVRLVWHAKKTGYELIQIQTNGRRFCYMDFCKAIVMAGATEFSPSIHGSCAEIHDVMTQAPGAFGQVVQGIKNLKKLKQRVMTNTVITKQNYKDLPDIARLLVSLDVDQYQFAFVHILGSADKNRDLVVPKKSEIMPYVKKGLDIGINAGKRVMTEAIPYCFMRGYEDYIAERIIPSTRVEDATWTIENYTEFRLNEGKIKNPEKCRDCIYYDICEGPWKEYPEMYGWDEFVPVIKAD